MSGITGLFLLDGRPVDEDTVSGMTAALAHRGRDGSGKWVQGSAGLGHRMLWSTPESLTEALPHVHATSGLVVTSDARIDNRDDLLPLLGLEGRRERPVGDGELIAAAYERWGEECADRLIGDFAFAIWDERRQGFFCARDCFGVKPIYYHYHRGRIFAFASEIKALLHVPEVPRRLNEARIADYLASISEDKASTFYDGILRLPPAHCLWADAQGLRIREYWRLDPSRELRLGSDDAYAEAFREVFTEAVRCRVRSAFPVGSTVSGGLDSSSIACQASRMLNTSGAPSFHTFSFVFDAVPESDERPYIDAALSALHAEKHYVHPDRSGVFGDVDRTLWHLDQPPFIRNLYLWTTLYEDASKAGVRVLLDGEDGDTVISRGDYYLYQVAMEGRWEEFERIIRSPQMKYFANHPADPFYWLYTYGFRAFRDQLKQRAMRASGRSLNEISKRFGIPRRKLLWRQGIRPMAPPWARRVGRVLKGRERIGALLGQRPDDSNNSSGRYPLLDPAFAARIGFSDEPSGKVSQPVGVGRYRFGHFQALYSGVASTVLEEDDKIAAQYGIEKRHPFFDRRLVELSLALPIEVKFRDGWTRWILRRTMEGILPEMVRWRTDKANLGPSFDRGMLELERERLDQFLGSGVEAAREYVNPDGVADAFARRDTSQLWPPFQLAAWLQTAPVES